MLPSYGCQNWCRPDLLSKIQVAFDVTGCLATVQSYDGPLQHDLQPSSKLPMAAPPPWPHECISGAWQWPTYCLQPPTGTGLVFVMFLLKASIYFQFLAKLIQSEQLVCLIIATFA